MNNLRYLLSLILLFLCFAAQSQVVPDTTNTVKGVVLHADPRLAVIFKRQKNVQLGFIHSGRGYRVQIYNGNDRAKATAVKIDFIKRFAGVPVYLTYHSPQYRIKVGDYRTRQEAQHMYQLAGDIYHPSMIVPDIIVINTIQND